MDLFIHVLVSRWNQKNIEEDKIEKLEAALLVAYENGYPWISLQITGLLAELELPDDKKEKYTKGTQRLSEKIGMETLVSIIQVTERWAHSLELLSSLGTKSTNTRQRGGKKSRVAWLSLIHI